MTNVTSVFGHLWQLKEAKIRIHGGASGLHAVTQRAVNHQRSRDPAIASLVIYF
jgi:phosphopantetheinyl transferase